MPPSDLPEASPISELCCPWLCMNGNVVRFISMSHVPGSICSALHERGTEIQ